MSKELKDFRGKITELTDVVLEARSRVAGVDRQDVVRKVLHEWALREYREANVLMSLAAAQGVAGENEGSAGSGGATRGR